MINEKDLNLLKEADDKRKIEIVFFMINSGEYTKDEIQTVIDLQDEEINERLYQYDHYMRGKAETMLKKVSHHLFIRNYVNDIVAKCPGCSKNYLKKTLSKYIAIILAKTCVCARKDIMSNHLMEMCFHTIEDELKDEFREFIYISLGYIKSVEDEKAYKEYYQKHIKLYACYLMELLENGNDEKLIEIKEKLKNHKKKEVKEVGKTKERRISVDLDQVKNALLDKHNSLYDYKMQKVYKEFFQYDQDRYEEDYYGHMKEIVNMLHEKIQKIRIEGCIYTYLMELYYDYYRIFPLAKDRKEVDLMTEQFDMSFFALLAYHLIHCNDDPDHNKSKVIVSKYEEIKDKYVECQKLFLAVYEELRCKLVDQFYMAIDIYDMSIVISVILEMDRAVIARKVKKIIYEDETLKRKIDDHHFSENIKYHFQLVKEDKISFDLLHDLASEFVLGYIQDKVFLAGNLAFVYYAVDHMKEKMIVYVNHYDQYIGEQCQSHDEIIKCYDEFINEISEDQSLIDESLSPLYILARIIKEDYRYYTQIHDLKKMLEKYRTYIIYCAAQRKDFLNMNKKCQFRFMIDICIYLGFIESIKRANQCISSVKEIEDKDTRQKLKEETERLKKELKLTKENIEKNKKNQQVARMKLRREINKEYEKNVWGYQKEISNLRKTVEEKEKELENHFQELCKLRELIFSQQVENSEKEEKSVDLGSFIKGKSIIILGGHYQLREKLKKKYPQLRFMGNGIAINDLVLANADYVFIFYHFLDHGSYYQVMRVLREHPHIEWDYIPYTNLQKTENDIYNKILKVENK